MSAVIILLHPPECHVCGKRTDRQQLKRWNDQDVCPACLEALHQEFEAEEGICNDRSGSQSLPRIAGRAGSR